MDEKHSAEEDTLYRDAALGEASTGDSMNHRIAERMGALDDSIDLFRTISGVARVRGLGDGDLVPR